MHDALVGFVSRRLAQEAQLPIFGMVQVGETAIDRS
jgi:hypothetical protein